MYLIKINNIKTECRKRLLQTKIKELLFLISQSRQYTIMHDNRSNYKFIEYAFLRLYKKSRILYKFLKQLLAILPRKIVIKAS